MPTMIASQLPAFFRIRSPGDSAATAPSFAPIVMYTIINATDTTTTHSMA